MRRRMRPALTLLLAVSASIALPSTAGHGSPDDARCDGRVPSRFESAVEDAVVFREGFGLPRTRGYVSRVLRNPRYRRLGADYGSPLTPRELRYLRKREGIEQGAADVQREARALALDAYAGVSIEDDFPNGAYVAVRFTRDHEELGAEVRRRVRVRVRALRAQFTLAQLDQAEEELSTRLGDPDEQRELERQDVRATGWGVDLERNRVVLDVISARPDVRAFVRERYGPRVAARVTATESHSVICAAVESYRVTNEGRTLKLHYLTNSVFRHERVEVVERDRYVKVAAYERAPNGPITDAGEERVVTAQLSSPLGSRKVVDAETGRALPLIRDGVPRSWREP